MVLLCGWLTLPQFLLAAEKVESLYEATLPLASRTPAAQDAAIRVGLEAVLIKISGYSQIATLEGLPRLFKQAGALVSEWGVQQELLPLEDGVGVEQGDTLHMRFVPARIDELVRQYEMPVWPSNRPQTLVVALAEFAGRPYFLDASSYPALFNSLASWADNRGVPIVVPIRQQLAELSVSARAMAELDQLAMAALVDELGADKLVVLHLQTSGATPTLELTAMDSLGIAFRQNTEFLGLADLLQLADAYADDLSLATAFVAAGGGGATRLQMVVEGVSSFSDFTRLKSYLGTIEQLDQWVLQSVQSDRLTFALVIHSGSEQLSRNLSQGGVLELIDSTAGSNADITLRMRAPRSAQP